MQSRRKDPATTWGTPTLLILYRTPQRWRFAIYTTKGVIDGGLPRLPADAGAYQAQNDLMGLTEDAFQDRYHVTWTRSEQPGWWTGEVMPFTTWFHGDR